MDSIAYDKEMEISPNCAERMNFIEFDERPGLMHFFTVGVKYVPEENSHAIVMQTVFSTSCIKSGSEIISPHFAKIGDWPMNSG